MYHVVIVLANVRWNSYIASLHELTPGVHSTPYVCSAWCASLAPADLSPTSFTSHIQDPPLQLLHESLFLWLESDCYNASMLWTALCVGFFRFLLVSSLVPPFMHSLHKC